MASERGELANLASSPSTAHRAKIQAQWDRRVEGQCYWKLCLGVAKGLQWRGQRNSLICAYLSTLPSSTTERLDVVAKSNFRAKTLKVWLLTRDLSALALGEFVSFVGK